MDIDLLSKMVKELILDNDQVTLPGLGDFVAQMMPASFSDKGYTINPPYRTLVFRSTLTPDTLLVDLYSKANNVDSSVARTIIGDFLSELKVVLQTNRSVVFPGLGKLRATKGNQYFFIADEELDIFPAGEGMEPVSMKTHKQALPANALAGLETFVTTAAQSVNQASEPVVDHAQTSPAPVADEYESPEEPLTEPVQSSEPSEEPLTEPVQSPESSEEPLTEPVQSPESSEEPSSKPVRAQTGNHTCPQDTGLVAKLKAKPLEKKHHRKCSGLPKYLKIIVLIVLLLLLFLAAFAVIGRLCPDFIDKILYNEQERQLIQMMGRI